MTETGHKFTGKKRENTHFQARRLTNLSKGILTVVNMLWGEREFVSAYIYDESFSLIRRGGVYPPTILVEHV